MQGEGDGITALEAMGWFGGCDTVDRDEAVADLALHSSTRETAPGACAENRGVEALVTLCGDLGGLRAGVIAVRARQRCCQPESSCCQSHRAHSAGLSVGSGSGSALLLPATRGCCARCAEGWTRLCARLQLAGMPRSLTLPLSPRNSSQPSTLLHLRSPLRPCAGFCFDFVVRCLLPTMVRLIPLLIDPSSHIS